MPNNNPLGPTVPNDIKNETIMRAWYQAMWATVRDLTNERISVKDYGAAGDGVQDDTTAFTAALAVADQQTKVLWIPKGHYKITSTITLANPVTILGEGESESVIEPFLGASGGDLFLVTSSDVSMKDFGFDGTNAGTVTLTNNMYMIHVQPVSGTLDRFYFEHLRFQNFDFHAGVKDLSTEADIRAAYGFKIESSNFVCLEQCYVNQISGGLVYTTGVSYIEISKNYIEDALLHPICIHDTTSFFNIFDNYFNPIDPVGVFSGGLIDVTSSTGAQCHHGNISGNFIKGVYNTSGYVSYGAVIRVLSSTDINISNNYITEIGEGSLNSDSDFVDNFNIKIGTYGTSSSDDNGPCKRINIKNNYISGARDVNTYHFGGILVENNYQTDNLHPAEDIQIIGNHLYSSGSGTSWLERGIVINGKSSGVKNVTIEDNYVIVAPENTGTGLAGKGAVSIVSDDSTGKCYQIKIGGNRIENLKNDGAIAAAACLTIGQYTSEVFNTKPNYLKGYSYGVVTETGSGPDLWYLDDNYYEPAGANNTKFVFNVQPKSKHTNTAGNTASRPTSTDYLTNYMTYFDTTLGFPIWYNGSSWVGAAGTSNFKTTYAADSGTVDRGPGDTLTVAGGTNISTSISGSTLTINNTAATPAPVGATYVTLSNDATLTNERVLTAGTGISVTDAGAGSTVTVAGTDATSLAKGIAKYDSSDFTVTSGNVVINDSGIDHDATTNYVANKHIDHTVVTLTAGEGITGGGDISTSRTFNLDFSDLSTSATTISGTDLLSTNDGTQKKITWANAQGAITTVGTVTSGTWSATTIAVNKGGTGQTSYTDGQLLIGNTSTGGLTKATLTAGSNISITNGNGSISIAATAGTGTVNSGTANQLAYYATTGTAVSGLTSANNGTLITDGSGVPSISSTLPSAVQGNITSVGTITSGTWNGSIVGLAYGGTNANLTASNGGIFYSTGSAGAILSGTATAGQILRSGAAAAPSWSTATYPATAGTAGKILRSDGTNLVSSTATFADTYTASNLLYSNGSNTVTGLATGNNGVLVTDGSGVPSISSTIPNATQDNITRTGTITSGTWSATTVAVDKGGTGQTSYTNGQLLIGNTTGNTLTKATLTAGNGITVTNGTGTITLTTKHGAPYFTATNTAQSVNGSTETKLQFDTENLDSDGCYDPTTNYRFTPTVAGKYIFSVFSGVASLPSGKATYVAIKLNNTTYLSTTQVSSGGTLNHDITAVSAIVDMNGSTDYVEAFVWHNNGTALNSRVGKFTGFRVTT